MKFEVESNLDHASKNDPKTDKTVEKFVKEADKAKGVKPDPREESEVEVSESDSE